MIRLSDYRETSGALAWSAYHDAQETAGERCPICKSSILSMLAVSETECGGCEVLARRFRTVSRK